MNLRRDCLAGVRQIIDVTRDIAWRLRMAHLSRKVGRVSDKLSHTPNSAGESLSAIPDGTTPLNKWQYAGVIMGCIAGICIPVYVTEDGVIRASLPRG